MTLRSLIGRTDDVIRPETPLWQSSDSRLTRKETVGTRGGPSLGFSYTVTLSYGASSFETRSWRRRLFSNPNRVGAHFFFHIEHIAPLKLMHNNMIVCYEIEHFYNTYIYDTKNDIVNNCKTLKKCKTSSIMNWKTQSDANFYNVVLKIIFPVHYSRHYRTIDHLAEQPNQLG